MPERMSGCQIECQIECQSICQKECQIECQKMYIYNYAIYTSRWHSYVRNYVRCGITRIMFLKQRIYVYWFADCRFLKEVMKPAFPSQLAASAVAVLPGSLIRWSTGMWSEGRHHTVPCCKWCVSNKHHAKPCHAIGNLGRWPAKSWHGGGHVLPLRPHRFWSPGGNGREARVEAKSCRLGMTCIWRFLKSPQTIQVMDGHFSIETRGDLRIPHFNQPDPLTIRLDTHMWCLWLWGISCHHSSLYQRDMCWSTS